MLLNLHIENVAIIEKSDIEFNDGFNVLTGETGAGKSIIIDSINLLLGNKGSKNLIRTGADFALVSAVFCGFTDVQKKILEENGIFTDDDGNLIVSRKISADGRTSSKINGVPVTVNTLKNIAHILVNIHGQHDGSKILENSTHILYLDEFCKNSTLLDDYNLKYTEVKNIRNEILKLTEIKEKKEQLEETLKFKIKELESADIKDGELEKLKATAAVSENISTIVTALNKCDALISGEEGGVIDSVSEAITQLESISKFLDGSQGMIEGLKRAKIEILDVFDSISKTLINYDDFDYSPEFLESRIYLLEKIVSKYGSEKIALENLQKYKTELSKLEDNEFELEQAVIKYKDALSLLEKAAEKLSKNRKKNAELLSEEICSQLKDLDMPNIRFEVSINRNKNAKGGNKYTTLGYDLVEFLISPNAGQQLKPLNKIASGGELSRIMLCLKTILNSSKGDSLTIIYDEVDSGVSGSTAQKIGLKLKKSAADCQVFSITHLAQIAALADNHYKVEKNTVGNITSSGIRLLDDKERIYEVARIMGGVEITQQILKSAEELIKNSKKC